MYKIDVECTMCGTVAVKTVANKSSAVEKYKNGVQKCFCSKECRQSWYSKNYQYIKCTTCSELFRYFPSNSTKFCSKVCYSLDMKIYPEKYNLESRASFMRDVTDKTSTTKKMLNTKVERGIIIDWKNATWKQWWRRCNAILRKKRKDLLGTWDGLDYIDGEFIKPYLALPYYHKNYPTLDHVIPKQKLFKEGYTPEEACIDANLKWTKRGNNSKKGYK